MKSSHYDPAAASVPVSDPTLDLVYRLVHRDQMDARPEHVNGSHLGQFVGHFRFSGYFLRLVAICFTVRIIRGVKNVWRLVMVMHLRS
jgi:hypothetical protein